MCCRKTHRKNIITKTLGNVKKNKKWSKKKKTFYINKIRNTVKLNLTIKETKTNRKNIIFKTLKKEKRNCCKKIQLKNKTETDHK